MEQARLRALFAEYDAQPQHTVKLTNDIAREWVRHNKSILGNIDVEKLEMDAQAMIQERKRASCAKMAALLASKRQKKE